MLNFLARNFRLRNVFRISNIFKLGFIYFFIIFWIIIFNFNFSDHFWLKLLQGKLSSYRIAIYSSNNIGESLLYHRMRKVASNLGIDYAGIIYDNTLAQFWFTRHFYQVASNFTNYLFKPNINIALTFHVNILPLGYNITYLSVPSTMLYNPDGSFKRELAHLAEYDAYADIYSFVHGKNPFLNKALAKHNLANKKIIPLYLAQEFVEYSPPNIQQAVITGSLWGCSRGSLRVASALKKLAEEELLIAYGLKDYLGFLDSAYKGRMESLNDHIIDSTIKVQKQAGISLIIHNFEHLVEGIPTSRIAEAAASGALIITDKHKFIENIFGNNVLYIDVFKSDEEIYQQVKSHIIWARQYPAQATTQAKTAYDIFTDHFTLEKQLSHLIAELKKP